jgi:hypothetical protein
VLCKKKNRKTNPWYDNECKIDRKSIRDASWYDNECKIARKSISNASNESLKLYKINMFKSLIKRKKRYYTNKKEEHILHLSKLDLKKFWRQICCKNK